MSEEKDNPTPDTGSEGGSVRDAVLKAFETHGAPVEEAPFSLGKPEEGEQPAAETKEDKPAKTRDERGKFAKAEKQDSPEKADKVSDQDSTEKATAEQVSKPAGNPPPGWSADAKAEWSKLSPALQQAVLKREQEVSDCFRQKSEEMKRYEELISPVREAASRHGIDEREGLKRLIAAQDALDRDPASALRWLAQSYGVDLTQLTTNPGYQTQGASSHQPQVPDVDRLIEDKLEQRELQRTIESFASNPDYPHFDRVRLKMGSLIDSGAATDLADAYDQAVWADKELREQFLTEQRSKAEADKRTQEQARVEKAKKADVSLRGSPNGGPSAQPKAFKDVRSAVEDAWRQHVG